MMKTSYFVFWSPLDIQFYCDSFTYHAFSHIIHVPIVLFSFCVFFLSVCNWVIVCLSLSVSLSVCLCLSFCLSPSLHKQQGIFSQLLNNNSIKLSLLIIPISQHYFIPTPKGRTTFLWRKKNADFIDLKLRWVKENACNSNSLKPASSNM